MSDGPRDALDVTPKALRKTARRAQALHGAEGAVVIIVAGGESHLGCTHSLDFLGAALEKALNDWRAAMHEAKTQPAGAASVAPTIVEAKHIPKLAALRALVGGQKEPPR